MDHENVIDGEVVELEISAGTALARVSLPREELTYPMRIALFNRVGRPVRRRVDYDQSTALYWSRLTDGAGMPLVERDGVLVRRHDELPIITYDGPDNPVLALWRYPHCIGDVQAREVKPGVWRADFIPEDDEFVTHFVLGRPGNVVYGGAFDEPVLMWRGHRLVLGVSKRRYLGETTETPQTYSDSRGRRTLRSDPGRLPDSRQITGGRSGDDRTADLDGGHVGDPRGLLPGAGHPESDCDFRDAESGPADPGAGGSQGPGEEEGS